MRGTRSNQAKKKTTTMRVLASLALLAALAAHAHAQGQSIAVYGEYGVVCG